MTRRALLAQVALAAAAFGREPHLVRAMTIRCAAAEPHPRLIVLDSDLDRLRSLSRDNPLARQIYSSLERECERLLTLPPADYRLPGPRSIAQVRHVVDRITTLALMYRITERNSYLRRAVLELRAVASFHDWNPSRFVDTAELTFACALGVRLALRFARAAGAGLAARGDSEQGNRSGAACLFPRYRLSQGALQLEHGVQCQLWHRGHGRSRRCR